jgi:peptidoglycan/xylan/chitin deacetylase (PgdA/CDA1 family)
MGDTLVLCYHGVSERWPASQSVTPRAFEDQVALLLRRGYAPVTFSEAVRGGAGRRFAVTFDDGYRSVLEMAKPVLDRLGLTATLFVPTDWIGSDRPVEWGGASRWLGTEHEDELRVLDWDDVAGLAVAGWEIGSHTRSHCHLTRCDDARLADELGGSRATLEGRLGRVCTALAYPFGDVDERVVAAAAAAGYLAAGAIPVRFRAPRPLEWPRVGVYHRDADHHWHYRLKASPTVRRVRASWVWSVYGSARRRLVGR